VNDQLPDGHGLDLSNEASQAMFLRNPDMVFVLNVTGRFVTVNAAAQLLLSYSPDQLLGKSYLEVLAPGVRADVARRFEEVLNGVSQRFDSELVDADGKLIPVQVLAFPSTTGDKIDGAFGFVRDISQQKKFESELSKMAYEDLLTGLPNFRAMQRDIEVLFAEERPFSLLVVNPDRFEAVKRNWAHHTGDRFLQAMTRRLRAEHTTMARWYRSSSDDLIAVVASTDQAEVMRFAELIQSQFAEGVAIGGRVKAMAVNIGISQSPQHGTDVDTLFRSADSAMYFSQRQSGHDAALYGSPELESDARTRQLEELLQNAAQRGELTLVFQPQMSLASGTLRGVEALVRWNSPTFGQIAPLDFVPIAEANGTIVEIGAWVLQTACAQIARWSEIGLGHLCLSVNVSIQQLIDEDFFEMVCRTLAKHRLDPSHLTLEITESESSNAASVVAQLRRLKSLGVMIAIDDFGTGYSSLHYLKDYPVDSVKIDRSFLEDVETNTVSQSIFRTIVTLATGLGLKTVAEGVETREQLTFVCNEGVECGQGFYFSAPLSPEAFARWAIELGSSR
jgi:diguanylate cyclase (GGDEF)-like protein/PAS domain S-box-containing protein